MSASAPKIGFVSLGCPRALVDSERIMTQLRREGYSLAGDYDGADLVIVNTCGFLDGARAESLQAIQEAMQENGKVIVTGCLGAVGATPGAAVHEIAPDVLAVTGPQQYEQVVSAVHQHAPRIPRDATSDTSDDAPYSDRVPPEGLRLTPPHYAYLKIAEGCDHACQFCVIPSMRGKLQSRPIRDVLQEAEKLVEAGVQELLVISQDTSVYGTDRKHAREDWYGTNIRAHLTDLCDALGDLDVWVRLHSVYPHAHVDDIIPLMAEGKILPYLDIPFQHASLKILHAMQRPASDASTLDQLHKWREAVPELAIRSNFIVGYPGETEEDFQHLLNWLEEAQLDHMDCIEYDPVDGARANALPDQISVDVKADRLGRFRETASRIMTAKRQERIGYEMAVLIDDVYEMSAEGRTYADAPEIDGTVRIIGPGANELIPGATVMVEIIDADTHDLTGVLVLEDPEDDWDW